MMKKLFLFFAALALIEHVVGFNVPHAVNANAAKNKNNFFIIFV
jgi:hypothetical protein